MQGFSKSIAIKKTLTTQFGKPDFIFAPNPYVKVSKSNGSFFYFRPLSTLGPMAIELGMPINIPYSYDQVNEITQELLSDKYEKSTIFISWSHLQLVEILNTLIDRIGDKHEKFGKWPETEFDRLVILKLTRSLKNKIVAQITIGKQGIDSIKLPDTCPMD